MIDFIRHMIDYFSQGGFVMPPLILATLVMWYALGWRYATLNRGNRRSVRILVERYQGGYDRTPKGIIDSAIVLGLELSKQCPKDLRRSLDDIFSTYELEVGRYSVLVRSIVIVAPLAGLLGTVTGMIETFDSLGDMSLFSQSGGIAGGISQALFSTQMGLAVAVPGRVVGRILDKRQESITRELSQVKDILCSEPSEVCQ
jgi:biopolymer transport protein ExbB